MDDGLLRLFLCGDVMLGRGVDQILAHPAPPGLREGYLRDARDYVRLAEAAHGPVPRPVGPDWVWGDALEVLDEARPDLRLVNLETSVTADGDFAPGKAVHYRMHPANLSCLAAVRPDACVLANNHVLDFGVRGLEDTLSAMADAGLRVVGAGRDLAAARAPLELRVDGGPRVWVLALGTPSSGIPTSWAATGRRPGVHLVAELSTAAADAVVDAARQVSTPGDVVVVSVHWGSNWGYRVPREQTAFAHRLIDGGVDLVHGHSSHHPRRVELYRGRLVLYGCGDFVDDYEGISGYAEYRPDLRVAYVAALDPVDGRLAELRMTPFLARRMRLCRAPAEDADWLRARLGTPDPEPVDGALVLRG